MPFSYPSFIWHRLSVKVRKTALNLDRAGDEIVKVRRWHSVLSALSFCFIFPLLVLDTLHSLYPCLLMTHCCLKCWDVNALNCSKNSAVSVLRKYFRGRTFKEVCSNIEFALMVQKLIWMFIVKMFNAGKTWQMDLGKWGKGHQSLWILHDIFHYVLLCYCVKYMLELKCFYSKIH